MVLNEFIQNELIFMKLCPMGMSGVTTHFYELI